MASTRLLPQASRNLSRLMGEYYLRCHQEAAAGKPVAWIAIIVPIELLRGFDLVLAVPENHAAMCAAKGVGPAQCEAAEAAGYSLDLCSYARIDLGTTFQGGRGSPTGGLPRADLLISNNNNCSLLPKWFDVYRRRQGTPHFLLDVPFCYGPQREKDLQYILSQYHELIRFIEEHTGQKFDLDRVRQAVACTQQAHRLWRRLLALARQRPAGITAFDTFAHMAPFLSRLRGGPELVAHLELLVREVEEQMARGEFPVPEEKYRLLWDNIAPWHQLRAMRSRLQGLGANLVYASYTGCIGALEGGTFLADLPDPDPLRHLARRANFSVCPYGLHLRSQVMQQVIRDYAIDGVIFVSNRSCKPYSVMQMDQKELITAATGVPGVLVDLDHADSRKYSEDAVFLRLEALLENIDAGRAKREGR
ncbi:MAG: 2-hydroxyacyl-CoA dehydratase family protein [Deltaproteobacteria bacterium]|nr:2-hydroxyacyl-CoA dehydratase family protein [Deltaproteobacteria bacterium]